jgi:two-component system cell cycle response regulator
VELRKAKESDACLVVMRGPALGARFTLGAEEAVIGRDPAVLVSLPDQSVSRKHAQVSRDGTGFKLTDLGSANGTHVNDVKLPANGAVTLAKDDLIKVGATLLKYVPSGEVDGFLYGSLGSAARSDPLTKLHNKAHFHDVLEAEVSNPNSDTFCVVYFDLDKFKTINDTLGHECGDHVLKEVAKIAIGSLGRDNVVLSRMGGDEFAALLHKTQLTQALARGEALRSAVEQHAFAYEGKPVKVTISVGVAEVAEETESALQLLKQADKALYAAKNGGRNQVKS